MDLTGSIKKAPRWAWYTVGGVGLGGLAIHFWKNRTTSAGATPASGSTSDGTIMGTPSVAGTGGSSPGVVIPPIITSSSPGDQSGTGLNALQNLYMGGVQDLISQFSTAVPQTYQDVWGPTQQNQSALVGGFIDQMAAGSAPQPAAQNPTPVVVNVPAPPPPPVSTPAAQVKPADPCPGSEFPFKGSHGCYKVACADGKGGRAKGRWHLYQNGADEHVSNVC